MRSFSKTQFTFVLVSTGVILLALSGCGVGPVEESEMSQGGNATADPVDNHGQNFEEKENGQTPETDDMTEGVTPADEGKEAVPQGSDPGETVASFVFYYVDDELMEIMSEEKELTYSDTEDLLGQLWDYLQSPRDARSQSLWNDFTLLEASLEGNALTIDVSKGDEVQFGSAAEAYAIDTLVKTFGQVDGVETIQLLVDGEVTESLAGHVTIDKPFHVDEHIADSPH